MLGLSGFIDRFATMVWAKPAEGYRIKDARKARMIFMGVSPKGSKEDALEVI